MKLETQTIENHQAQLTIEVEPDQVEEAKRRGARNLAKRAKIPGFRPGKAPYQIVLRYFGEEAVLEEAIELLVDDIYPDALKQAEIQPYGPGSLKSIPSKDPLVFEFTVPLQPVVTLCDYHSIEFPYEEPTVTDDDVDKVIDNLRNQQAVLEPVEREVQNGDVVTIVIAGTRLNVDEGENPILINEQSVDILVNEDGDQEEEWPFPGFSKALIGNNIGDELSINHVFDETSRFESLRGQEATFHSVVQEVKSRTLPELSDEFAKSVGDYADIEALREDIASELKERSIQSYNLEYQDKVLDEVISQSSFVYPAQMLEREIDDIIANLENRLENQKLDMDLYLKSRQMDVKALREEAKPAAEERLRRTLAISEISQAEKIQVEPSELQEQVTQTLNYLSQSLSKDDAKRLANKDTMNNLVSNSMMDIMTNKTLERIRLISSGQYDPGFEEDEKLDEVSARASVTEEIVNIIPDETSSDLTESEDNESTI